MIYLKESISQYTKKTSNEEIEKLVMMKKQEKEAERYRLEAGWRERTDRYKKMEEQYKELVNANKEFQFDVRNLKEKTEELQRENRKLAGKIEEMKRNSEMRIFLTDQPSGDYLSPYSYKSRLNTSTKRSDIAFKKAKMS